MNMYSMLAIITSSLYLMMGLYIVMFIGTKNRLYNRLLVACASLFVWNFLYVFIYSLPNTSMAMLLYKVSSLAWVTFPISVVIFYHTFAIHEHNTISKNKLNPISDKQALLMYLPCTLFVFRVFTDTLLVERIDYSPIGNIEILVKNSYYAYVFNIYFIGTLFVTMMAIYIWGMKQKNNRVRKATQVIFGFSMISFVIAVITFIMQLTMDIRTVMPLLSIFYGLGMWTAITKYNMIDFFEKRVLSMILDKVDDIYIIVDRYLMVRHHNVIAISETGYDADELSLLTIDSIIDMHTIKRLQMSYDQGEFGNKKISNAKLIKKNGEKIPVSITVNAIQDDYNDFYGHLLTIKDLRLLEKLSRQEEVIMSLASAIEIKDQYTEGHSQRVRQYSEMIARRLGYDEEALGQLGRAALLHDIGKIGINHNILNKEGPLSLEEYEEIKLHPEYSRRILDNIRDFDRITDATYYHHERYDGKGYPTGLAGTDIPLDARIIAIADTFDALTSTRAYREAKPKGIALKIIEEELGKQFDPNIGAIALEEFGALELVKR